MDRAPNGLRPLLRAFQQQPQVAFCAAPLIAYGQCGWVSASLVSIATKMGWRAHLVLLEEPDATLKEKKLPTYERFGACTSHVVACIDGWYIDYTARQYDRRAPFPVVTPDRAAVVAHWGKVTEPATVEQLEEAAS